MRLLAATRGIGTELPLSAPRTEHDHLQLVRIIGKVDAVRDPPAA
jgi:hypothetical protein